MLKTENLYRQDGHPTKKLFVEPEELNRSMLNRPRDCHDFIPVGPDGNFYLADRQVGRRISDIDPVWMMGGAVQPFMTTGDSIQSVMKREFGREIDLERLVFIRENRYFMNGEAQNGFAHDAKCDTYALLLYDDEIRSAKLDPKEYSSRELQPYDLARVMAIKDPFIRKIFMDLWNDRMMIGVRNSLIALPRR